MKTAAATPRLAMTRREAAAAVGVSLNTIERAIHSGALKAKSTGGRHLIRTVDLEAWLDGLEDV